VSNITLLPQDRLIKIDVSDFYMTGEHYDLSRWATAHIDETLKDPLNKLIFFVLGHQFVVLDKHIYRVKRGSGMGLSLSGEVSDCSLLHLLEVGFMLDDSVREKYGVVFYGRFKDDMLVVQRGSLEDATALVRNMRSKSKDFRLKIESVSKTSVTMLDVFFGEAGGPRLPTPHCQTVYQANVQLDPTV